MESGDEGELKVEIYLPYLLKEGMVDFPITPGSAGCSLKIRGLSTDYYDQEVYGADTLQALQLASDVEDVLKHISNKYALFFSTGEPYFE